MGDLHRPVMGEMHHLILMRVSVSRNNLLWQMCSEVKQWIQINVIIYLNMPDKMLTLKCENYILWQSGEDDVFTCAVQKYMH